MSGEIDLGSDPKVVSLIEGLAGLVVRVPIYSFAVIGGLAVLAALEGAHRVTDDVDTVAEQHGEEPTIVEVVAERPGDDFPGGMKIDCISVGDTPASELVESELPEDDLDRAFVLSHRWAFDTAQERILIGRIEAGTVVIANCRFATPASLVAMKLQSAPKRRAARSPKAGGDYFDIFRMVSHPTLVRPIAEALASAPLNLGPWSVREIRAKFLDDPGGTAAIIARSGVSGPQAPMVQEAGETFLEMWSDGKNRTSR